MCPEFTELVSEPGIEATDRELFDSVRQSGFTGPAWDLLAASLVRHALAVLGPWIRTGRIFEVAARKGHPLNPTAQEQQLVATRSSDDFVQESVVNALDRFRRTAREGRGWRAEGGATLAAYFIGACVYAFIELFRKSRRSGELYEARFTGDSAVHANAAEVLNAGAPEADPAKVVLDRLALQSYFAVLSERDRGLVWGKASGYSGAEIAVLFEWSSAKAVERRWARLRRDHPWLRRLAGEEQQ